MAVLAGVEGLALVQRVFGRGGGAGGGFSWGVGTGGGLADRVLVGVEGPVEVFSIGFGLRRRDRLRYG